MQQLEGRPAAQPGLTTYSLKRSYHLRPSILNGLAIPFHQVLQFVEYLKDDPVYELT
jgi:hypothetical protein